MVAKILRFIKGLLRKSKYITYDLQGSALLETQYPGRICCTSNHRGKKVLDLAGFAMQHLFMMHMSYLLFC